MYMHNEWILPAGGGFYLGLILHEESLNCNERKNDHTFWL